MFGVEGTREGAVRVQIVTLCYLLPKSERSSTNRRTYSQSDYKHMVIVTVKLKLQRGAFVKAVGSCPALPERWLSGVAVALHYVGPLTKKQKML